MIIREPFMPIRVASQTKKAYGVTRICMNESRMFMNIFLFLFNRTFFPVFLVFPCFPKSN